MRLFIFQATLLWACPQGIAARDLSLIRIQDDAIGPSTGIEEGTDQNSFLDVAQSKSVDFAGNGCDCVCDCVPGTDDCSCACICKNPEDEETAAAQKLLEEKRRLRLERRRKYERELQATASLQVTTPAPSTLTVPESTPAPTEGIIEPFSVSDPPSDMPSSVPSVMLSSVPSDVPTEIPATVVVPPTPLPTTFTDEDCPQTVTPTSKPSPVPTTAPTHVPTVIPVTVLVAPTPLPTTFTDEDCPQTVTPTSKPSPVPTPVPSPAPSEVTDPDCPQTEPPRPSPANRKLRTRTDKRRQTVEMPFNNQRSEKEDMFDFIVAGFPKCGTTTLLEAFAAHSETDMNPTEKCVVASPGLPDPVVLRKLDETISEMSAIPNIKRSFKCPTAIYNHKTISRMEKHSPDAKFIVGVRHPILMMQSFYNYRVTEIYQRGLEEKIPSFEAAISRKQPWKGVSVDATRFDLFLKQYGKTDMSPEDLFGLMGHPGYQLAIQPNRFNIFLYTVDQMQDEDKERNQEFRASLQRYLGLSEPLAPFSHENINHHVGAKGFNETIDICEDRYSSIRKDLIEQGIKSADWIRDHFIRSRDVVVANEKHFLATLDSWRVDPCAAPKEAPIETAFVSGNVRNEIAENRPPRRRGLAVRVWEAVSAGYFNQGD